MTRIYLIGFMGSGKTAIGKVLANKLNLPFVDLDERIEKRTGMTIAELFSSFGEKEFRKVESSALFSLRSEGDMVVSTGGGTPCFHDNMDIMNSSGMSIYLEVGQDVLLNRLLQDSEHRPLLSGLSKEEMQKSIQARLSGRLEYYMKATYVIDGELSIDDITSTIENMLSKTPAEPVSQ